MLCYSALKLASSDISVNQPMRILQHGAIMYLLLAGCAQTPPAAPPSNSRPQGAQLSTADAIRIARHTAESQGLDLRNYKDPQAYYQLSRKGPIWSVFFDGQVAMPTNRFTVLLNERTGEIFFRAGKQ